MLVVSLPGFAGLDHGAGSGRLGWGGLVKARLAVDAWCPNLVEAMFFTSTTGARRDCVRGWAIAMHQLSGATIQQIRDAKEA